MGLYMASVTQVWPTSPRSLAIKATLVVCRCLLSERAAFSSSPCSLSSKISEGGELLSEVPAVCLPCFRAWWIPSGLPEFDGGLLVPRSAGAVSVGREEVWWAPFILPVAGK